MAEATLTSKGQITIPAEIRRAMGLKPQDRIVFTTMPDGTTVMRAKTRSLLDLVGTVDAGGRKVSVRDMRLGRG